MNRTIPTILITLVALTGCDRFKRVKPKDPADDPRVEQLRALVDGWRDELTGALDDGWIDRTECDGTLWNGLACAAGVPVNLALAEYEPGQIHRRPAPSCYTREGGDVGSQSTVSNDMLLGYEFCAWRRRDVEAVKRLAAYGEAHDVGGGVGWVMGEPYPERADRVLVRPNGLGRVGTLLERLTDGSDKRPYRIIPEVYASVGEDFERHLQVIGIILDGEADRIVRLRADEPIVPEALRAFALIDIPKGAVDVLEELADASPNDALFQAARGIYSGQMMPAIDLLINPAYECPSYVRGAAEYCTVHKLIAADTVLRSFDGLNLE